VRDMLAKVDVPVIFLDAVLCSETICKSEIDGVWLYKDANHFSRDGSVRLAARLGLGRLIETSAR